MTTSLTERKAIGEMPPYSGSTAVSHQTSSTHKATILELPDEAIELIFSYLKVFDTSGTFARPRDAFHLAVTNTRLLRLYGAPLRRVTLNRAYVFVPTLNSSHMLSALRLAGRELRELHLPGLRTTSSYSIADIIEYLPIMCPRLEELDVEDDYLHYGLHGIDELLDLSLRSLSIADPRPETLRSLVRVPEELCLTNVWTDRTEELISVLRLLPKKLYLQIVDLGVPRELSLCLHDVCPMIEEVTFKLKRFEFCDHDDRQEEDYGPVVSNLLLNTRRNNRSICRKMVMCPAEGFLIPSLIHHAHPEAVVEISQSFQTYVYDGNELHVKALPLWDEYLSEDLSNLTEISITYFEGSVCVHPLWKSLLAGKHFSRVFVENASDMAGLYLNADVVVVPHDCVTCKDWKWLGDVNEVRIIEAVSCREGLDEAKFLKSLAWLLDTFRGKLVRMLYSCRRFSLEKNVDSDIVLFDFVVRTLNAFEARGGDGGDVRSLVEDIRWQ